MSARRPLTLPVCRGLAGGILLLGILVCAPRRAQAQESPTVAATATETAVAATPTATLELPTDTPSPEPTLELPTDTPSPEPTASATAVPTDTSTAEPSATETPSPAPTSTPSETGTPTQTATRTPPPTERGPRGCHGPTEAEGIQCGDVVPCSLAQTGDTKSYQFFATAGDAVCISTAPLGTSPIQPRWHLVDPGFAAVPGCSTQFGGLSCCHDLPASGRYTILVQDAGDDETGSYTISIHGVASSNRTNSFNCAQRLSCGAYARGTLHVEGDIDAFRFSAVSGDAVFIGTTAVEGSPIQPRWQLYQPDGRAAGGCGTTFGGQDACNGLAQTGTYTLLVSDAGADQSGDYAVALQFISASNCCAVSLSGGESIQATITGQGQVDAYVFTSPGVGGVSINTAPTIGSSVQPEWRVYDALGKAIRGCSTTAGGQASCPNLSGGASHTIIVSDASASNVGDYTLALQGDADPGLCRARAACTGDCDLNGTVGVGELVVAVNDALTGRQDCAAADKNASGVVAVNELVEAVLNRLEGCP
jgi:hypothetical protein